jgi:hypothetical protein
LGFTTWRSFGPVVVTEGGGVPATGRAGGGEATEDAALAEGAGGGSATDDADSDADAAGAGAAATAPPEAGAEAGRRDTAIAPASDATPSAASAAAAHVRR